MRVNFVFVKMFNLLWLILYDIRQIFVAVNDKIFNKYNIHLVTLLMIATVQLIGPLFLWQMIASEITANIGCKI